ncbi:hypothetical protein AVEN_264344-1 [Araneus ventricosus]|uniref:DDE Tnp4 domain-containing protein n=1 Tax=Araneus ventricosus TaxID=182803 RepID=A0A4Y2H3X8_ARAVE|nr:hypothetical protein AVEN_264344-1 [Araneus ventricosus]
MSSADFEKLIRLIAPKVAKKRYKISVSNSCCRKIGHNFTFFSDWGLLQQFGLSDRCFQTVNLFHSDGCMQSTDSSSQKSYKASLQNSNFLAPNVIVADGAFALNENIMKPYSHQSNEVQKRIFNYHLSRARRVVENVFGICSSTFRILRKPMLLHPEKTAIVSMTVTLLHNFLRASESSNSSYCPPGTFDNDVNGEYVPGLWRKQGNGSLLSLQNVPRRAKDQAKEVRETFAEYFNGLEEGGGLITAGESSKSSDMSYSKASSTDSRDCKTVFSNGGRTAIGRSSVSTEVGLGVAKGFDTD